MGHILKFRKSQKTRMEIIKFGMKKLILLRARWIINLHERRRTFWLWLCKNHSVEFLAKETSVNAKGQWGGQLVITSSTRGALRPRNANSLKSCDYRPRLTYGFDIIGGVRPHGQNNPHIHTKSTPVFYGEKKNKIPSFCRKVCLIIGIKSFHFGFIRTNGRSLDLMLESMKTNDERLPNKSSSKAENKKLADLKKAVKTKEQDLGRGGGEREEEREGGS